MEQREQKLKIYFTSDVHGYFYPTSYGDMEKKEMGLFACAGSFEKDENTLIIDGGDILQGSAFAFYCSDVLKSPKPIAEIMNDCGYDFYTLGNHDFNYGQAYQEIYRKNHRGTCICQNVTDEAGKVLYPYQIKVMPNGMRVGLVGIVSDYVNIWEKEENLTGIRITDPLEAAKKALLEMKEQSDLTICVYHGGFERNLETKELLSETKENVAYHICEELDFDILLTGHQHMSVEGREILGTFAVQPADNAREYQRLEIILDGEKKQITSACCKADSSKGTVWKEKYAAMEAAIQEWLNLPLGHLSEALVPESKVKMALNGTKIADFINEIQLHFSKAQISTVGLANEITGFKKEVSRRDIIATYPYPNTLIVCKITGEQLRAAMERSAEYFDVLEDGTVVVAKSFLEPKEEHYNYDYFAGAEYEICPANPIGSRITKLTFEGKPVQDSDSFTLCLNNYRYSGAGGYPMYPECPLIKEINREMVELIMEYFAEHPYIEV